MKSFPTDTQGALGAPFPQVQHAGQPRRRGVGRAGGSLPWWEREQDRGAPNVPAPAQGSPRHASKGSSVPKGTPTGTQTIQARFIQTGLGDEAKPRGGRGATGPPTGPSAPPGRTPTSRPRGPNAAFN